MELQEIRALNLCHEFGPSSFMDEIHAYLNLEEGSASHSEMSDGEQFLMNQSQSGSSPVLEFKTDAAYMAQITAYAPYMPYFVENPFDVGTLVGWRQPRQPRDTEHQAC